MQKAYFCYTVSEVDGVTNVIHTETQATIVAERRNPGFGIGTAVCLVASLFLVAKWCQACSSHYPWGVFQALFLPGIGLIYAVGSAVLWAKSNRNTLRGGGY